VSVSCRRRELRRHDHDRSADADSPEKPFRLARKHPDAAVGARIADRGGIRGPMDADSLGPRPIQRVPSGFPGPGGIGCSPSAQSAAGGYHQGRRILLTILKRPSGVGLAGRPVPAGKTRARLLPWYRKSRCAVRRTTITGPKFARVTAGRTRSIGTWTAARSRPAILRTSVFMSCERRTRQPARARLMTGRSDLRPTSRESVGGRQTRLSTTLA
jgi:hypothetical protein